MNIQIYGTKNSSDTRKTERFFKERGIKFQSIDLKEKGLSKGEFNSVMQAGGKGDGEPERHPAADCPERPPGDRRLCAGSLEDMAVKGDRAARWI